MSDQTYTFTSESVSEGHPDKVCDYIADSILDACLEQDPHSHVACEVLCKDNHVILAGEITTNAKVDYEAIARRAVREIGYTDSTRSVQRGQREGEGAHLAAVGRDQRRRREGDRRPEGAGRRRPGHHVRLRHVGEPGADAAAPSAGAPAHQGAGRRSPQRIVQLAPPRRQIAGLGRLRGQHAAPRLEHPRLHPARRRNQPGQYPRLRREGAGAPGARASGTRRTPRSSSTRAAASLWAGRRPTAASPAGRSSSIRTAARAGTAAARSAARIRRRSIAAAPTTAGTSRAGSCRRASPSAPRCRCRTRSDAPSRCR